MNSTWLFVIAVVVAVIAYLLLAFRSPKEIKRYLTETEEGRGALKGIVMFVLFGIILAVLSMPLKANADKWEPEGQWFSYAEVYLGLEWPKNTPSPQCVPSSTGMDARGTSNGGVRMNIFETYDNRFHLNAKYTHHSCSLNKDRNHYDALGFEIIYRFYSR